MSWWSNASYWVKDLWYRCDYDPLCELTGYHLPSPLSFLTTLNRYLQQTTGIPPGVAPVIALGVGSFFLYRKFKPTSIEDVFKIVIGLKLGGNIDGLTLDAISEACEKVITKDVDLKFQEMSPTIKNAPAARQQQVKDQIRKNDEHDFLEKLAENKEAILAAAEEAEKAKAARKAGDAKPGLPQAGAVVDANPLETKITAILAQPKATKTAAPSA